MPRRDEIRAAIQNLLSTARQPDEGSTALAAQPRPVQHVRSDAGASTGTLSLDEGQLMMLRTLQTVLQEYGVEAAITDIVQAIIACLATRPSLCRGLLAAYLVEV